MLDKQNIFDNIDLKIVSGKCLDRSAFAKLYYFKVTSFEQTRQTNNDINILSCLFLVVVTCNP